MIGPFFDGVSCEKFGVDVLDILVNKSWCKPDVKKTHGLPPAISSVFLFVSHFETSGSGSHDMEQSSYLMFETQEDQKTICN